MPEPVDEDEELEGVEAAAGVEEVEVLEPPSPEVLDPDDDPPTLDDEPERLSVR